MNKWDSEAALISIQRKQPEQAVTKDPWPLWLRLVVGAVSALPFLFALAYWTGPW